MATKRDYKAEYKRDLETGKSGPGSDQHERQRARRLAVLGETHPDLAFRRVVHEEAAAEIGAIQPREKPPLHAPVEQRLRAAAVVRHDVRRREHHMPAGVRCHAVLRQHAVITG